MQTIPRRITKVSLFLFLLLGVMAPAWSAEATDPLHVDPTGRWLVNASGAPVFLMADTAWDVAERVKRDDVTEYFKHRRAQRFNTVTFVLFHPGTPANVYGAAPFKLVKGKMDPTQPILTPGASPEDPKSYDYWDHVDFTIDEAARQGLYAILLPCWGGSAVTGSYAGKPTKDTVFNEENACVYGRWVGARYANRKHVIWMIGGDCAGAYPQNDYRAVFRAMAEGLAEGIKGGEAKAGKADFSGILMSFHPQKPNPQSSTWFNNDPWLSFNSIQAWPEEQIGCITRDWNLTPAKPTWIFEGRYEAYYKNKYKPEQWGEWQCRQQAWQTVFAGAFGHTYGHEHVFSFGGEDNWDWKKELDAPGARSMTHLAAFMNRLTPQMALSRCPDQSLIDGDAGKAERLKSNRITAMRAKHVAMFYSANGHNIRVKMDKLAPGAFGGCWFNPRNGQWSDGRQESADAQPFWGLHGGPGAPVHEFDPPGAPGDGNDWVLVLAAEQQ